MKPTAKQSRSRMVAGVPIDGAIGHDELLRAAIRVAMKLDADPGDEETFDGLMDRVSELMKAYVRSPEGDGEDPAVMLTRLAFAAADVIPLELRIRAAAH